MALVFQCGADGADAPIHHVRRRDDIAACFRLDQGLAHQHLERRIIVHIAVPDQPVMAVAGIGIQRHIAQNADLRDRLLDRPHGCGRPGCRH